MSVDNRLMVKTLQGLREFYTVVSKATRMHFVECDPETFDDQAYIFTEKQDADSFAADLTEKNYPASAERIGRNKIGSFNTGLYLTGVNSIVFRKGAGNFYMPLSSVVTMKRPD